MRSHRWNDHWRYAKTIQWDLVAILAAIALDQPAGQLRIHRIVGHVIALARIGVVRALAERVAKGHPAIHQARRLIALQADQVLFVVVLRVGCKVPGVDAGLGVPEAFVVSDRWRFASQCCGGLGKQ